jgi:hypothetical protein
MDPATAQALAALGQIVTALGPWGLACLIIGIPVAMPLIVLWMSWVSSRRQAELLETYRADTQKILKDYGDSLDKVSRFYGDNVQLVKGYERVARDLHDVVVLNTTTIQRCCDLTQNRNQGQIYNAKIRQHDPFHAYHPPPSSPARPLFLRIKKDVFPACTGKTPLFIRSSSQATANSPQTTHGRKSLPPQTSPPPPYYFNAAARLRSSGCLAVSWCTTRRVP